MARSRFISRRQALTFLAVGSAAAALHLGTNAASHVQRDTPPTIRQSHLLMGAVVNLTLVSDDPAQSRAAATAAVAEMRHLAGIYTRYDSASQLSQLNAEGVLRSPDPALVNLLQLAHTISRASQGAFDVSVKPLLDLYLAAQGRAVPNGAIDAALQHIGYTQILGDSHSIGFARPGMGLTLDGIAKGAVVDRGVSVLRDHGFDAVIVEAGGDLLASGAHGVQTPWKIGLRSPRAAASALPSLYIQDRAVATSGDYLQPFAADYSVHHLLDPRRGVSSPELACATVVAPAAVLADALATAIMVVGRQAGLALLRQFPGCEAYLVDKQLQATASPGMAAYLA